MDIGKLIKSHRIQQNLSMNELARRSDVGQSGLSEIEAGKRLPTFDNLERIVTKGFNMSLSDFFLNNEPELTPQQKQLINLSKDLSSEQLNKLIEFIKSLND